MTWLYPWLFKVFFTFISSRVQFILVLTPTEYNKLLAPQYRKLSGPRQTTHCRVIELISLMQALSLCSLIPSMYHIIKLAVVTLAWSIM